MTTSLVRVYAFLRKGPIGDRTFQALEETLGPDRTFVLLDGDSIFGPAHLAAGFLNAARSIEEGRCRAKRHSMEVLRLLGGSNQVSGGMKRVSPGKGCKRVLLAVAPVGWPGSGDGRSLSSVSIGLWKGGKLPGLESIGAVEPSDIWAGPRAGKAFGLDESMEATEMEAAILEMVATADL